MDVLGSPVPNSPYGFCGRKATLNERRNEFWQFLEQCAGKRGSECGDPHAACVHYASPLSLCVVGPWRAAGRCSLPGALAITERETPALPDRPKKTLSFLPET